MIMSDSILKFELLKSTNYYAWKGSMQAALVLKDLWDATERNSTWAALEPAEKTKQDAKAMALITVCI